MTRKVSRRPVGRPPKISSPYQQISKSMATVFDKTIDKVGGADAIADLLVTEMTENGKVLEVLKVVQTYLPRQHSVEMELSASDNLSNALANVQSALELQRSEKAKVIDAQIIDAESGKEQDENTPRRK